MRQTPSTSGPVARSGAAPRLHRPRLRLAVLGFGCLLTLGSAKGVDQIPISDAPPCVLIHAEAEAQNDNVSSVTPATQVRGASVTQLILQATYNTSTWTGDLRSFRVSGGPGVEPCPEANKPRGQLCEEPGRGDFWSLADRLDGNISKGIAQQNGRRVFGVSATYAANGDKRYTPLYFRLDSSYLGAASWTSLSEDDQRALLGLTDPAVPTPPVDSLEAQRAQAVIDFIAGKDVDGFRGRESLVGDIINGAPVVVGPPGRVFSGSDYQSFVRDNEDRQAIAYVGANDGLLRGVSLETGIELFAYVPRPLFGKLALLTEPGYGTDPPHTNYVDGPIAEGDAFFAGTGQWRSVVVGALGAGAQALYAIRSPNNQSEMTPDLHLWDFTDRDDPDLGYVFGKPAIVRVLMSDGRTTKWVAVFGNGYSSSEPDGARPASCDDPSLDSGVTACGQAVLYVVEIETGRVIGKFRTGEGRAADPRHSDTSAKEPNGLAQPAVVGRPWTEGDGDLIATVAYAGDLFGNLWRFNLRGLSGSGTAGESPVRVFRARREGRAQPITAPVALAAHPTGVGTLVLFGTGRHLGLPDVSELSVQSFYGIWDKGGADTVDRSDLRDQAFDQTGSAAISGSDSTTNTGRPSTRNTIDWSIHLGWYLDLPDEGERVVSAPQLRGDRVVFTSLVVYGDVCRAGGVSWLNAVAFTSGSALDESPFDFNLSGTIDSADLLATGSGQAVGTSLRVSMGGLYSSPAVIVLPGGETLSLISSSKGDLTPILESSALRWRVWHQLQ